MKQIKKKEKSDQVGIRTTEPEIRGRVASLVATVAHVNSLMDISNQWSLSVVKE